MKRALAVSPCPSEAVLACGATLAGLAAGGWDVTLVTVFDSAAEDVAADEAAAATLGLARSLRLGLAPPVPGVPRDRAAAVVAAALGPAVDAALPDRIFAPLAEEHSPAHTATTDALRWLDHPAPVVRWRPAPGVDRPLPDERGIPVAAHLDRKLEACAAYGQREDPILARAEAEGRRLGVDGPAEALVEPPKDPRRRRPADEADEKAQLVRALRGSLGLTG